MSPASSLFFFSLCAFSLLLHRCNHQFNCEGLSEVVTRCRNAAQRHALTETTRARASLCMQLMWQHVHAHIHLEERFLSCGATAHYSSQTQWHIFARSLIRFVKLYTRLDSKRNSILNLRRLALVV